MADHPPKSHALPAIAVVLVAMLFLLVLSTATAAVTAQDTPTEEPTSEFSLNLPPTFAGPTATFDPNNLVSLSGVGGQAVSSNVAIRSGPGLQYPRISYLPKDRWIDIVGWNGWEAKRICTTNFQRDLDMWVQVQFGERRGWIARCVLDIRGQLTKLPIVSADGTRDLQR
jgi:hypothetical protein